MHTLKNLTGFYGDFDFSHQDVLRFMDILEENYDEYLSHLFESSNKVIKRNTNVCYFDCTNFYFEKESEDEDVYDEITGELIKGLFKNMVYLKNIVQIQSFRWDFSWMPMEFL